MEQENTQEKKKCPKCGTRLKIVKTRCFKCKKEIKAFQNERNFNFDFECCLSCLINLISEAKRREKVSAEDS